MQIREARRRWKAAVAVRQKLASELETRRVTSTQIAQHALRAVQQMEDEALEQYRRLLRLVAGEEKPE